MAAPTFKKATDTDPGDSTKYGAPDVKYAFDVLDATHATDRIQASSIETTVGNVQTDIDSRAPISHTHPQSEITSLVTDLAAKAPISHTHVATTDLTATGIKDSTTFLRGDDTWAVPAGGGGGVTDHGALTGLLDDDHTQYQLRTERNAINGYVGLDATSKILGSQQVYGAVADTACVGNDSRLSDARTPLSHSHIISDTTGLQAALDGKQALLGYTAEDILNKGAANGYASLDASTLVPVAQIPSLPESKITFSSSAITPSTATKASGTITFSGAATVGSTITINGRVYTGVLLVNYNIGEFTFTVDDTNDNNAQSLATEIGVDGRPNVTVPNIGIDATRLTNVVTVTASAGGTAGNSVDLASSHANITVSGSLLTGGGGDTAIDFSHADSNQAIAATADLTLVSTGLTTAAKSKIITITNGGSDIVLSIPSAWTVLGYVPLNIQANSTVKLLLASSGPNDSDVVMVYESGEKQQRWKHDEIVVGTSDNVNTADHILFNAQKVSTQLTRHDAVYSALHIWLAQNNPNNKSGVMYDSLGIPLIVDGANMEFYTAFSANIQKGIAGFSGTIDKAVMYNMALVEGPASITDLYGLFADDWTTGLTNIANKFPIWLGPNSGTAHFGNGIELGGAKATNAADGTAATDLVTKQQLDAASGTGESNDIQSVGGGTAPLSAIPSKSGVNLQVKSLSVTAPITLSDSANLLTLDINDLADADISASAGIAKSKISSTGAWTAAEIPSLDAAKIATGTIDDARISDDVKHAVIPFTIDNGASVLVAGLSAPIQINFPCTIEEVVLFGDVAGSITIDFNEYLSLANYDAGTKTSIVSTGTKPNLSSSKSYSDTSLTNWDTTLDADKIYEMEIEGVPATVKRITGILKVIKT